MDIVETMRRVITVILVFLSAALFSACTTIGPKYTPAPQPESKSLIYFFRDSVERNGGYRTNFMINRVPIVALYNSGYSWVHIDPGEYQFIGGGEVIELSVEPGKTYYLGFNQENFYASSFVSTKNTFRVYSYEDAKQKISRFRYKKSTTLDEARIDQIQNFTRSSYKEPPGDKVSKLILKRSLSLSRRLPNFYISITSDSESCSTGTHNVTKLLSGGNPLVIQAEGFETLHMISSYRSAATKYSCDQRITFQPNAGEEYTLHLDIDNEQAFDAFSCTARITDHREEAVPVMLRKPQSSFFKNSSICSKSEFERKEFVDLIESYRKCYIYIVGGGQKC